MIDTFIKEHVRPELIQSLLDLGSPTLTKAVAKFIATNTRNSDTLSKVFQLTPEQYSRVLQVFKKKIFTPDAKIQVVSLTYLERLVKNYKQQNYTAEAVIDIIRQIFDSTKIHCDNQRKILKLV